MIRRLAKKIYEMLDRVFYADYTPKGHQIEMVGQLKDSDGKMKDVILTVTLKHYIPRDQFGEAGYIYVGTRKRKIKRDSKEFLEKNPNAKIIETHPNGWITVEEPVNRYEMSEADMKFVYNAYTHWHLTARQMAKLSKIPEPYIVRYIKHKKMKPKHEKIDRKDKVQPLDLSGIADNPEQFQDIYLEPTIDIPDELGFKEPFHLDPFPTRSEWKVRREELGLKNGENWRGTALDENPGPRQYGDGSKSARRNLAKLARKEKRKKKNIQKFNLHQNNRYGMTMENPEGTKDPYKQRREMLERKKNKGKE